MFKKDFLYYINYNIEISSEQVRKIGNHATPATTGSKWRFDSSNLDKIKIVL